MDEIAHDRLAIRASPYRFKRFVVQFIRVPIARSHVITIGNAKASSSEKARIRVAGRFSLAMSWSKASSEVMALGLTVVGVERQLNSIAAEIVIMIRTARKNALQTFAFSLSSV